MPDNPVRRRGSSRAWIGALILAICAAASSSLRAKGIFDDSPLPPLHAHATPATQPATQPILAAIAEPYRRPQPPKADLTRSRMKFKAMYAADLSDSSSAVRLALADKLSHLARRSTDVPADEFALLSAAVDAAREGADLDTCFRLVDQLALAFDVDPMWLKADSAINMPPSVASFDGNFYNSWTASELVDRLIDADDLNAADRVATAFTAAAAGEVATQHQFQMLARDVNLAKASLPALEKARHTLTELPEHPSANLTVGRYLCFTVHAWRTGLPMLAKGTDPALKAVARFDFNVHYEAAEELELAGMWLKLSTKETDPLSQREERDRAIYWYRVARAKGLQGADDELAAKRIADYEKSNPDVRYRPRNYGVTRRAFTLQPTERWATLDYDVRAGRMYRVIAHGRWKNAAGVTCGPDGVCPEGNLSPLGPPTILSAAQRDLWYLNGEPRRSLIARVVGEGESPTFYVGCDGGFIAPAAGALALRVNDGDAAAARAGGIDVEVVEVEPRWFDNHGELRVQTVVHGPMTLALSTEGGRWVWSDPKPRPASAEPRVTALVNGCYWWPRWTDPTETELLRMGDVSVDRVVLVGAARGGEVTLDKPAKAQALFRFKPIGPAAAQVTFVASVASRGTLASNELLRPSGGADAKRLAATDMAAALDAAKKQAGIVEDKLGVKFTELDTEHFAIFTDWDPREYPFLRSNVEQAYDVVAKQFRTSRSEGVFVGTLPIYMFSKQQTFKRFAQEFDNFPDVTDVLGYFMPAFNGFGHMAMWKPRPGDTQQATQKAEHDWARTLTHEFTHAFVARYRSLRPIPVWLNEGVAEVVGNGQVPLGFSIYPFVHNRANKKDYSLKSVFAEKRRLAGDDYPVVQTVVETLQALKPDAFLPFFNDIKDGIKPEDALKARYQLDFEDLERAWRSRLKQAQ